MSERRACRSDRERPRQRALSRPATGRWRIAEQLLKTQLQERRRFGYRRLHVLRREGRPGRKSGCSASTARSGGRRGGRKRAIGTRRPLEVPLGYNQRWSLDFIHDQLTDGRRFRIWRLSTTAPGSVGADRRYLDLRPTRCPRAERCDPRPARKTERSSAMPWNRADLKRHPELGGRDRRRLALHRARKAAAERLYREFQWSARRRTAEQGRCSVSAIARAIPGGGAITTWPAALQARLDDACGLCSRHHRRSRLERCATPGSSAPASCQPQTEGSNQPRILVCPG